MVKLLILFIFLFSVNVFAEKNKRKNQDQTIRFSEETIEGKFNTSNLFYLLKEGSRDNQYLFKLRSNFKPEMKETGIELEKSLGN